MSRFSSSRAAIQAEAANWILCFDEGPLSPNKKSDFLAWLRQSPQHVEEFLLSSAAWREFDDVDSERWIDVDELLNQADVDVVRHISPHTDTEASPKKKSLRGATALRFAAVITAIVGATILISTWEPVQRYSTEVGEQSLFRLDDGSIVRLNTQSELTVRIDEDRRELKLVKGEAMFDVARDTRRPFRVQSGSLAVQALGTQFNVYRVDDTVRVSVVEGTVRVGAQQTIDAATPSENDVILTAGEGARGNVAGSVARIDAYDLNRHIAWIDQRLVFRDSSLLDAAAEFNRYNAGQIVVDVPESLVPRISATFDVHDPESFVAFLRRNPDLSITESSGVVLVQVRRGDTP